MRVLIVPLPTFPHLASESQVQMFFTMIRNWLKLDSRLFFYIVLPADANTKGFVLPPKTEAVYLQEISPIFYDKQTSVPVGFMENFNPRMGKYICDVVVTARTNAALQIRRMLWDYRMKSPLPVIVDEDMAVNPVGDMPAPLIVTEVDLLNRSLAYAACCSVFDTELEKKNAIDTAKRYVSWAIVKKILVNSNVIPPGIDIEWIDNLVEGIEKNDQFTLFFGGRLNQAKRAIQLVRQYDYVYAAGRPVRIVLCTPKQDDMFKQLYVDGKGRAEVEIYKFLPPYDFLRMAAASHVYLASSRMEGFSNGFLQQLYLSKTGLVPILPDLPWTRALLGDVLDKYKFVYRSFEEAGAMIRWIYEHYEEACELCKIFPDIVKKYNATDENRRYLELMKKQVEEFQPFLKELWSVGNVELMEQALSELTSPFSIDDMVDTMCKFARVGEEYRNPIFGRVSRYAIYRWLLTKGYEDTCEGPQPVFERAEV